MRKAAMTLIPAPPATANAKGGRAAARPQAAPPVVPALDPSMERMRVSEIRYRRLFEASRDGILILDPGTRKITDANPFMTELLGYPHEELLGKELWQIGLLKDEVASQAAFRQLQADHYVRYDDLPLQSKTGKRHEVEFVSNLYKEDGREVIQCNIRDITQRKRMEEVREWFTAIVESSEDAIISKTIEGVISSWNPGAEKLFGYTAQEVIGKSMRILMTPERVHEEDEILARLRRGEQVNHLETVRVRKDGKLVDISATISPIRDGRGRVIGASKIARDITERKRAERALVAAKEEISRQAIHLEQVVAERTEKLRETVGVMEGFSYSLSHDMRAPLRAMQSYAQFLVDEYSSKLDEQGVKYLQQIMRSSVRLDRLIRDVLSYTTVIHTQVPMERVDLDRLVRDIVETYPNGQPIKPQIRINGRLPTVMGNEALLTQCISNLLSNGAKFVAVGTTPRVEIWAEAREPDLFRVWFKDNGVGIAPEDHERIFRMFERIHPVTEYEGTGIGLTIVRKAAERMGAPMGFESELGDGSRFWIELEKG